MPLVFAQFLPNFGATYQAPVGLGNGPSSGVGVAFCIHLLEWQLGIPASQGRIICANMESSRALPVLVRAISNRTLPICARCRWFRMQGSQGGSDSGGCGGSLKVVDVTCGSTIEPQRQDRPSRRFSGTSEDPRPACIVQYHAREGRSTLGADRRAMGAEFKGSGLLRP